jgi:hypothetical protein
LNRQNDESSNDESSDSLIEVGWWHEFSPKPKKRASGNSDLGLFSDAPVPKAIPEARIPSGFRPQNFDNAAEGSRRGLSISSVASTFVNPTKTIIRFQFLIADESLGAISKPLDQCSTSSAFFHEALAAFTVIGGSKGNLRMAGVRVVIESSAGRPIFVPWGNEESYGRMMEGLMEKAADRAGTLEVEITCVQQRKTEESPEARRLGSARKGFVAKVRPRKRLCVP